MIRTIVFLSDLMQNLLSIQSFKIDKDKFFCGIINFQLTINLLNNKKL